MKSRWQITPVECRTLFSDALLFMRRLDRPTQALLAAFVFLVIIHHFGIKKFGDDIYFADNASFQALFLRYFWWTSRIFIESVLTLFACLPVAVFAVFNGLLVLTLPFLLARLAAPRMEAEKFLFPALCFVLMYPVSGMREAGWIATYTNYLWPLVAALVAVIPVKKLHDGEHVSSFGYILYSFCLLFACNNELICIIFMLLIPVYVCLNWNSVPRIIFVYAGIVAASLLFILTCPGNNIRYLKETITWLPQFPSLGLIQKLYYGYMSFAVPVFFHTNFLLVGLTSVLCFGIFRKYTKTSFYTLAIVPIFAHLISSPSVINETTLAPTQWEPYMLLLFSCGVMFCLTVTIYLLADTAREFWLVISLPVAAFAARGALSFSPTVFASGQRTSLFVYASLAITALWAYSHIYDRLTPVMLMRCRLLLLALAFLCVLKG